MKSVFYSVLSSCLMLAVSYAEQAPVFEPFDYPAGNPIKKQNGGEGFDGNAWDDKSGNHAESYTGWEGLSFSDMPVSGNSVLVYLKANKAGQGGRITRKLGSFEPAESLWISFLFSFDSGEYSVDDKDTTVFLRLRSDSDGAIRFRVMPKALDGSGISVLQAGKTANRDQDNSQSIADGGTWLIVAEFPYAGDRPPQIWALSAQNYDALKGRSLDTSLLEANSTLHATATPAAAQLKPDDNVEIGVWSRKANAKVTANIDELRIGNSLSQVIAFPE